MFVTADWSHFKDQDQRKRLAGAASGLCGRSIFASGLVGGFFLGPFLDLLGLSVHSGLALVDPGFGRVFYLLLCGGSICRSLL